jgi:hypothetical protein
MLGIQAIANGHAILPNYQVRYSLKDFDFFKNSMVKNVALVDEEMQGKQYTSNQGGSGFGKFRELPNPEVIAWETNENSDLFIGRHDGFENVGVAYTRQVIFVKDEFWIVKDEFSSNDLHDYKQVWQGHYTLENGPNLLRATAPDAAGHDIFQINKTDSVFSDGTRGKHWSVVIKEDQRNYSFITVIYPYKGYSNRLDETSKEITIGNWEIDSSGWEMAGKNASNISNENEAYFFGATSLKHKNQSLKFSEKSDIYMNEKDGQISLQNLTPNKINVTAIKSGKKISKELQPGEEWNLTWK